jgi:hypothetical protein
MMEISNRALLFTFSCRIRCCLHSRGAESRAQVRIVPAASACVGLQTGDAYAGHGLPSKYHSLTQPPAEALAALAKELGLPGLEPD